MQALGQKIRELTDRLVRIDSSNSYGQRELGEFLAGRLREVDYVRQYPDSLQQIQADLPGNPFALLALYRAPPGTRETIVFCGHIDTVGVEEFGPKPEIAFDPAAARAWLAERCPSDAELLADIASGDFMFGRGSLDMKGGVALLVSLFERLTADGRFPWNLALLLTFDEEGSSTGMRVAVPRLRQMQDEEGLDFGLLINCDYASPLTREDANAYSYTGTIGKLLIGVSVFGTPTHAGAPFEGVNAAALAGAIVAHLEGSHKLTQHVKGEFTPPPTALLLDGRQLAYSVMTPSQAHAYFNLFFAHSDFEGYFGEVVNEVRRACRLHLTALRRRYRRFVARADVEISERLVKPEVISYSQLAKRTAPPVGSEKMVVRAGGAPARREAPPAESSQAADSLERPESRMEPRQQALAGVARAMIMAGWSRPTVVVSVLPPFYPAYAMAVDSRAQEVFSLVRDFARDWKGAFMLRQRQFYPYVSDMSFVRMPPAEKLKPLLKQMPLLEPSELLPERQQVSIPVVNLGPWGKGAHTARERVHLGFLTEELPKMHLALLSRLVGSEVAI